MARKSAHGEGSFEKIGQKYRHVRTIDGIRTKGPLKPTKAEARQAWQKLHLNPKRSAENLSLATALSRLFPEEPNTTPWKKLILSRWRPTTYDIMQRHAQMLKRTALAKTNIGAIDRHLIAKALAEAPVAALAPKTKRHLLHLLKTVLNLAELPFPPGVTLPRLQHPKKRKIIPVDQRAVFLACFSQAEQIAVSLMLTCGLRPSEACGLCHEDREEDGIQIRRAVTRQTGSSNVDQPKTRQSHRWVPLVDPVLLKCIGSNSGFVLDSGHAGHPVHPAQLNALFRRRLAGTQFQGISPQDLRRSAATAYALAAVPVHVAARNMGHSVAIMLEIYAQVSRDDEREAARQALG